MKYLIVLSLAAVLLGCEKEADVVEPEETSIPTERSEWAHGPLTCKGYYGVDGDLKNVPMETISQSENEEVLKGTHENYHYEVKWNKSLETLYTRILVGDKVRFLDTTRVPTQNHNDTFGEVRDEMDFRLAISCAFAPVE